MKAAQVVKLLRITRPTLTKYVKNGTVRYDSIINGQYRYNEDSVYEILNGGYSQEVSCLCSGEHFLPEERPREPNRYHQSVHEC